MFKDDTVEQFRAEGYTKTVDQIDASARVSYLKKVYGLSLVGVAIAGVVGYFAATLIGQTGALQGRWTPMLIIFGAFFVANFVCAGMVRQKSSAILGFVLGNAAMGFALGYMLLAGMLISQQVHGDAHLIIAQALGLTLLVTASLAVYVWSNPGEFRWAQAIMAAAAIPMLILMVVSFVFPIGGTFGLILSVAFVVISVIGLLMRTKAVMQNLGEDQVIEGAYLISLGVIVLFWNILALLLRLTSRE